MSSGNLERVQLLRSVKPTNEETQISSDGSNRPETSSLYSVSEGDLLFLNISDELLMKVDAGNLPGVQTCLQKGGDPNYCYGIHGSTSLHLAAARGMVEILSLLINNNGQIEATDGQGQTPLCYAAQSGSVNCLKTLLQYGANTNVVDYAGTSVILLLGSYYLNKGSTGIKCYTESINALIRSGARVNVCHPVSKDTPLHQAATLGRLESIKSLIAAGAAVNAANEKGSIPLHISALKGHALAVKLFLARPADAEIGVHLADAQGWTALHKAAHRGSNECVRYILEKGADLGAQTEMGVSAISFILKLPNGVKLLSQRFDSVITATSNDSNDINCRMTFDYSMLFTRHKLLWHKQSSVIGQQMDVIRSILDERPFQKTADLLQHPLVGSFLHLKWHKIRVFFFSTLIAYLILVVGITAYILAAIQTSTKDADLGQLQFALAIIVLFIILQEIAQIVSLKMQYFTEVESWVKLVALVTSTAVIFAQHKATWLEHTSVLAVLFGWIELTLLLGRLPTFGVYAHMFNSVAGHLGKCAVIFFFFFLGFAFSFHILFQDSKEVTAFRSPFESILRTVSMMLGDFGYENVLRENSVPLAGTAHIIYGCFLGFVALILMNLLTGLAVDDIAALRAEGYWRRLRHQAKFIIYLEDVVGNQYLQRILPNLVTNKLNNWINQHKTFTTCPAMPEKGITLPPKILDQAIALALNHHAIVKNITIQQTHNLVLECSSAMQMMVKRLEKLELGNYVIHK